MIQLIVLPRTRLTTLIGRKKLVIYGLSINYGKPDAGKLARPVWMGAICNRDKKDHSKIETQIIYPYQLKPEQIVDFKSMIGDNSDNIVGIPGIGPKTALKLLHKFHNLDNLLINLKQIPDNLRNKIEPFRDRININRLWAPKRPKFRAI
ncbi:5'-3' exonuclease H3TH domain-containing protein [Candidatus Phytoplasma bonamiae]|uniref:5'-3' exonuclease n=1 Tax=Candidatus Phytoplasma bonamiae TaxID=2982626 RepID=A0ABT9D3Z6_9MOLU|nr:5'-3' exonuclease H3TH domain-containing protein ['Bonamia sp.' little leaf phytoplasma]MDO8064130.1 hypothetical protein ['Bonamia sp.' little leaf phytoplasma]MDV3174932.1 5'-3' exonuclease H3TH domain-containing protein ['Bonamia sp.' little leaf phytoplasma]